MNLAPANSLLVAAALVALSSVSTAGGVLFDGAVAPANVNELAYNDTRSFQRVAEDFTLAEPAIFNRVTFLGGYYPASTPVSDSFTLILYNSQPANGTPDPASIVAQIHLGNIGRSSTGVWAAGADIYSYTGTFPGITLAGGVPYWLSLVNDTGDDPDDFWAWAGAQSGTAALSRDAGTTWELMSPEQLSFVLEGTAVPEPTAAMLLAAGALAAFARKTCAHR